MNKKKLFLSLLLFIISGFIPVVFAQINVLDNQYMIQKLADISTPKINSVTSNADLVTVKASGNIIGYYYGTSTSVNNAAYTSTTSNTYYAAVKNGVYYFWVAGSGVSTGNVNAVMYPYAVRVSTSCSNQSIKNCTGSGTFERCYVYTGGKSVSPESGGDLVTPAPGYKLDDLVVSANNCSNLSLNVGNQKLSKRYCKVVLSYKCSKIAANACDVDANSADCLCSQDGNSAACACAKDANSADCKCKKDANSRECACARDSRSAACTGRAQSCSAGYSLVNGKCVRNSTPSSPTTPYLTALSVSPGALSPAFNTKTVSYNVTVDTNVSQITINATGSRGSAAGTIYGTGLKNLSYGDNVFKITIMNSAESIDYYVTVFRKPECKGDKTLKSITLSEGDLEPSFQPDVNSYNVKIEKATTLSIDAALSDEQASFVEGFGPRSVDVPTGNTRIDLKVQNTCGETNVYAINVTVPEVCDPNPETSARLKSIELKSSKEGVVMPIINFSPDEYVYSDLAIPNDYGKLTIVAGTEKEGDTFEIKDLPSVLTVNRDTDVSIVVTSRECPEVQKTYTLILTRQEPDILNSNASLSSFSINNHPEFKFQKNKNDYEVLKLKKNEKTVTLNYIPEEDTTVCIHYNSRDLDNIDPNADLTAIKAKNEKDKNKIEVSLGDDIYVECKAEDGVTKETYKVKVVSVAKKTNALLVIIIVILIVLLLLYLVLRLLGYKIYFNFAMIGAFFRGIGESISNLFDR